MQVVGIFTTLLTLTRTALNILPKLLKWIVSISGGIGAQVLALLFVAFLLPKLLDLVELVVKGVIWLLDRDIFN